MDILNGIAIAIFGIISLSIFIGLIYYIIGEFTNTTITPVARRKVIIKKNKSSQVINYEEIAIKSLLQLQAELKSKGIYLFI